MKIYGIEVSDEVYENHMKMIEMTKLLSISFNRIFKEKERKVLEGLRDSKCTRSTDGQSTEG